MGKQVLSLDGGGVRGISTLIILKDLLAKVDEELEGKVEPVLPKEVFDVIVGTSTGGLIALMLVKLNLNIDQCIEQYKKLSRAIFSKPHPIGKWTGGLMKERYSGDIVRKFVVQLTEEARPGHGGENLMMEHTPEEEQVQCTVVCRELRNDWKKTRVDDPFFLCSHRCRPQYHKAYPACRMCDAACATSAAPTYFEARKILGKILVDGGFIYTNNPSKVAFDHYLASKKSWSLPQDEEVIWVNLGTGSPPPDKTLQCSKRPAWSRLVPKPMFEKFFMIQDVTKMITDAEEVVKQMTTLVTVARGYLKYSRFSANNGLHEIGLDDWEKVEDNTIQKRTEKYLAEPAIQMKLAKTAKMLAEAYKQRRAAVRHASEVNSPLRPSNSPLSQASNTLLPVRTPQFMADDLSADEVPALSRLVPTEPSEAPRTPQPVQVEPASDESQTKSRSSDTTGSGQQFHPTRPHLNITINEYM